MISELDARTACVEAILKCFCFNGVNKQRLMGDISQFLTTEDLQALACHFLLSIGEKEEAKKIVKLYD